MKTESKIFFTSDWHFSHVAIMKFCPQFRPYDGDIHKMDEDLIQLWNQTVSPNDVVYNLGDVSFAKQFKDIERILRRLNGHHHLILGNHDDLIEEKRDYLLNTPKNDGLPLLSSIEYYRQLRLPLNDKKQTIILSHYPILEWDGCHKGWWHLYGHLHDRLANLRGKALNVGYDLHGRFLELSDIEAFLQDLPSISHFHNKENTWAQMDKTQAKYEIENILKKINQ